MNSLLPEQVKSGFTWRRFRNVLRSPFLLFRNARFWWNDKISEEEHIFVMGPPRSGTTLLKTVLETHSKICGIKGETWFFLRTNYTGFRHQSVKDEVMKQLIRKSRSVTGLFDRFAETIKKNGSGGCILEKTPSHALRLNYITQHFPESVILFLVRDPRDCVRSAREHPIIWSNYPDEDRLGGYIEVWRRSVQAYFEQAHRSKVVLVRYEDFCREPENVLQSLAHKLDIDIEDHQLDPERYGDTSAADADSHRRLREPITPESVGHWKDALSDETVTRIETELSVEMRRIGYSSILT